MKHNLQSLYQSTFAKYKKFKTRFDKNIESGFFYELSLKRQRQLVARIERLRRRLSELKTQLKLAVATGALVISLASATSTAKAQELGPFVQNAVKNPFKPPSSPRLPEQHPAAVDIDNDGDLDVFVGNRYGRIEFLRNDGTANNPTFVLFNFSNPLNPANGIDVGNDATPTFADLDGDGDFDLIVGRRYQYVFSPYQNIRYFENTGTVNNPIFDETSFQFVDDIFSDAYFGHPALGDLDGDGDLDALLGNENINYSGRETVLFWEKDDIGTGFTRENGYNNPFRIINPDFGGTLDRAAPTLVDIDNDGDLDLFVGDANGNIRFFPNLGDANAPVFSDEYSGAQNPLDAFNFYYNASPEFADLDNDGDFDVIVGQEYRERLQFLINDGTSSNPNFVLANRIDNPFDGIDTDFDAAPATVDIDGDSFLDVVIGQKYSSTLLFFTNNQDGTFTEQSGSTENPFDNLLSSNPSGYNYQRIDPDFADIDNDGDSDLFIAARSYNSTTFNTEAEILFFRNDGNFFNQETSPIDTMRSNREFGITLGNLTPSADSDIDAIIGMRNNEGNFIFVRNDGTPTSPIFNEQLASGPPFNGIDLSPGFSSRAKPQFVDLDHDGDLDLAVGIHGSNRSGQLAFFINDGIGNLLEQTGPASPFFDNVAGVDFDFGIDSHPAFIDIDNDGDLDLLVGEDLGTIIFLENQNIAPTIMSNGSGSLVFTEGDNAAVLDGFLDVSDATSDLIIGARVNIQNYVAGEDFLSFTSSAGVTGIFETSGADAGTLVLTASSQLTPGEFAVVLRSVTYENTSEDPTSTTRDISFQAIDFDNTLPDASNFVVTVGIVAVNDAPIAATSSGDLTYTEDDPSTLVDSEILVTDVDNANLEGATISLTSNFVEGEDLLEFTNQNGITGSFDTATGILTLTGSSSVANYQAALRDVRYFNTSQSPSPLTRTTSFLVDDGEASSVIATKNILVIPINDAPEVVSENAQTSITYIQDSPPIVTDALVEIIDADDTELVSATVELTGFLEGDILNFEDQNGISGIYEEGALILSGTASVANYITAFRTVTFETSNGAGTREIRFTANDGTDESTEYIRSLIITGESSEPPEVDTTPATTQVGSIVTIDLCQIISDPDNEFDELTIEIISTLSGAETNIEGCDLEIDYSNTNFSGRDEILVRATDPDGNSDENTLFIEVEEVNEPAGAVVIYNAVSPNNDGSNDYWEIENLSTPNSIVLFNRWGDEVKSLTDYDGSTPNNQLDDLPTATYFYKISSPEGDFEGFLVIKK